MVNRMILQMILLSFASSAWALPISAFRDLGKKVSEQNCQRSAPQGDHRNVIRVSVIGEDDRKPISETKEEAKFSEEEIKQAMHCTGTIICPRQSICDDSDRDASGQCDPPQDSAGAVCPPGSRDSKGLCAPDRLGSAGHVLINKVTNRLIEGAEQCRFYNYKGFSSTFDVSSLQKLEKLNPRQQQRADKIVLLLKDKIPGCDPYDNNAPENRPTKGMRAWAMTYAQADMDTKLAGQEPLLYPLEIKRVAKPKNGQPSLHYSTADLNGVGSGGFLLVRRPQDKKIVVAGLFIRAGESHLNGQEYNEEKLNYSVSVGTDGDFIQLLKNPGMIPEPQVSEFETGVKPVSQ